MSVFIHTYTHFSIQVYGDHRDLHSFPTRRSSDLDRGHGKTKKLEEMRQRSGEHALTDTRHDTARDNDIFGVGKRSEEHTSELQSHSDLVCRLLLEKKKRNKSNKNEDYT